MFTWLFALLTALCTLAWMPVAHACKCAAPEAPQAALERAAAVFEGEVTAIDEAGADLLVTLHVTRAWKGIESAEQVGVRTQRETAACGYPFALGQSYLVYAQPAQPSQAEGALAVGRCTRTRPSSEAAGDIQALGLGSIPVNVHAPTEVIEPAQTNAVERKRDAPAAGGCASCGLAQPRRPPPLGWLLLLAALAPRVGRRMWPRWGCRQGGAPTADRAAHCGLDRGALSPGRSRSRS